MKRIFEKIGDGIFKMYEALVVILFMLIITWLLFLSMYSTSYITADSFERTFFVKDSVLANMLVAIIFLVLVSIGKRSRHVKAFFDQMENTPGKFELWKKRLLIIGCGIAFFWILVTQVVPGADQISINHVVYGLRRKDYTAFMPGGYLKMYNNQLGIVLFLRLLAVIFGDYNYMVFQMLNVFALAIIYKEMSEIGGRFGLKKTGQLVVIVVCILFLPFTLYTTFVYGNLIGFALALLAIKCELMYFEEDKKKYMIGTALLIALAVLIKSNYLIFLLGMAFYAMMEMIRKRSGRACLLLLCIGVCYIAQSVFPKMYYKQVTGIEMGDSASSWSWIAMGMQRDNSRGEGWYNEYVEKSFAEAGYDAETQKKRRRPALQSLSNTL